MNRASITGNKKEGSCFKVKDDLACREIIHQIATGTHEEISSVSKVFSSFVICACDILRYDLAVELIEQGYPVDSCDQDGNTVL